MRCPTLWPRAGRSGSSGSGEGANANDQLRRPLTREWARSARLSGRPHPAGLGETRAAQRGGRGAKGVKAEKAPIRPLAQDSAVRLLRRVGRKGVPTIPPRKTALRQTRTAGVRGQSQKEMILDKEET